jgi:hypothetical protein
MVDSGLLPLTPFPRAAGQDRTKRSRVRRTMEEAAAEAILTPCSASRSYAISLGVRAKRGGEGEDVKASLASAGRNLGWRRLHLHR